MPLSSTEASWDSCYARFAAGPCARRWYTVVMHAAAPAPRGLGTVRLTMRRATAFLVEAAPVQLVSATLAGPFIAAAIHREGPWSEAEGQAIGFCASLQVGACVALVWFALRDTVPGLSWGKWLLGLRVTNADGTGPAAAWRRALRNLCLAIPFFEWIEGTLALLPWLKGRRLGDWIAGTRICPREGRGDRWNPRPTWLDAVLLLGAGTLFAGAIIAGRYVTEEMFWRFY